MKKNPSQHKAAKILPTKNCVFAYKRLIFSGGPWVKKIVVFGQHFRDLKRGKVPSSGGAGGSDMDSSTQSEIFFLGLFTNEIYLTHFLFRFGFSAMRRLFAKSTTFLSSGVPLLDKKMVAE